MALVQNNCPNCGAPMRLVNNQLTCSHCGSMVLEILDAKIDANVDVMSAQEFAKKIQDAKKQFVITMNDHLQVFDADTLIINKRIKDATKELEKGNFGQVLSILKPIDRPIFSVARLRLLADEQVKNEYELASVYGTLGGDYFNEVLKLADEKNKEIYIKIAEFRSNYYNTRESIKVECQKVDEIIAVELYDDAIAYAKNLCQKYPTCALSWVYFIRAMVAAKKRFSRKVTHAYAMMKLCPDFKNTNGIHYKTQRFLEKRFGYKTKYGEIYRLHLKKMWYGEDIDIEHRLGLIFTGFLFGFSFIPLILSFLAPITALIPKIRGWLAR